MERVEWRGLCGMGKEDSRWSRSDRRKKSTVYEGRPMGSVKSRQKIVQRNIQTQTGRDRNKQPKLRLEYLVKYTLPS